MKIKPCPFCGESNAIICTSDYLGTTVYHVSCRTRGCAGVIFCLGFGLFNSEKEAITAWNTRANDDALLSLVDGCYEIIEVWKAETPLRIKWKKNWLKKARELGAEPMV